METEAFFAYSQTEEVHRHRINNLGKKVVP